MSVRPDCFGEQFGFSFAVLECVLERHLSLRTVLGLSMYTRLILPFKSWTSLCHALECFVPLMACFIGFFPS